MSLFYVYNFIISYLFDVRPLILLESLPFPSIEDPGLKPLEINLTTDALIIITL